MYARMKYTYKIAMIANHKVQKDLHTFETDTGT